MNFVAEDIVHFDSPQTGYAKYHLCVLECADDGRAACFLFLNSKGGFKGDYILDCADIPCLPPSKTGKSVVSFSQLVRMDARKLRLFRAKKLGALSPKIARKLETFAKDVFTLTTEDRKIVLKGLARIR